jgi:hypothetical protein
MSRGFHTRSMLSSWVPVKRPPGAPRMTYGRSIQTALKQFNIDSNVWPELAMDRTVWRETLRRGEPALRRSARAAARPRAQQLPASLLPRSNNNSSRGGTPPLGAVAPRRARYYHNHAR